jgi:hypothetical protein
MISFSITCGIGLNGRRRSKIISTIRAEYGILSRKFNKKFYIVQLFDLF